MPPPLQRGGRSKPPSFPRGQTAPSLDAAPPLHHSQGTCTPLHADVLRSYSWSANVAGRKRWRLLAPKHAHLLRSPSGREVAWGWDADDASYSAGAAGNEDSALPVGGPGRFPGLALALALSVEVVQVRRSSNSSSCRRHCSCPVLAPRCSLKASTPLSRTPVRSRQAAGQRSSLLAASATALWAHGAPPPHANAPCHVQEAGEAIFVPSGWYHTVENLEDTLSINHNWLNAHNVHWAWALARRECAEAAAGIEDCQPLCRRGAAAARCLACAAMLSALRSPRLASPRLAC
jgi:hypothetical protein